MERADPMMINTNPLTGSWVVREYHVTGGVVTRVCYDAYEHQVDAIKDARERQERLLKADSNMVFDYGSEGIIMTNLDYPYDHIVIGVTMRNIARVI
jgi:hypothetical protein